MIDFLIAAALGAVRAEEPPSLLVIAPQALRAPAEEYALQRRTDLPTEFMTLEQALTSSGTDDPERLKRTIFAKWQANPSLRHVLLVGDADILPVRYMVLDRVTPGAFDYAFYPSDLYYADLARRDGSFDDWNRAQGDGSAEQAFHALYFGEVRGEKNKNDAINFDAIDYRPEVAVGRWPASSVEEVQRIARKSLAWCGRRRPAEAALIAVSGWIENRPMMDHLAACLPRQWVRTRLYWKDAARDDGTPQPDAEAARELLMRGVPFIFHSGHGSDDAWDQSLHASMAPLLTNHYEPVMLLGRMLDGALGHTAAVRSVCRCARRRAQGNERRGDLLLSSSAAGAVPARGKQSDGTRRSHASRNRWRGCGILRMHHGKSAVRDDVARGVRQCAGARGVTEAWRCVDSCNRSLLDKGEPFVHRADRELVSVQHLLPGDEVHPLR